MPSSVIGLLMALICISETGKVRHKTIKQFFSNHSQIRAGIKKIIIKKIKKKESWLKYQLLSTE